MEIRGRDTARWRQLPAGVRDQTTEEVAVRRRLEGRLREVFARWGYAEVATPTLEYLDTFLQGAGPGIGDRLLKLVDSGGEVLALRPEMTVPLARFASTRLLPAGAGPLRLAYVAPMFRGQERGSGQLREFTQAGVELIGDGSLRADVEVIALAAEALHVGGLHRPAISVGHAGFLRGVLSTLPEQAVEPARELLYRKAFADLDSVVPKGPALDALRHVPALRGQGALDRALALASTEESRDALAMLREVLAGVAEHAQAVRVEVDLGLIRDFEYYTGTVFEAHAGRAGRPLLGGGRYDGLLGRFGTPAPATGFALSVDRVMEAGDGREADRPTVVVRHGPGAYPRAVQAATRLRDAGIAVIVAAVGAPAGAGAAACTLTVTVDGLWAAIDGQERPVTPEAVVDVVRMGLEPDGWTR